MKFFLSWHVHSHTRLLTTLSHSAPLLPKNCLAQSSSEMATPAPASGGTAADGADSGRLDVPAGANTGRKQMFVSCHRLGKEAHTAHVQAVWAHRVTPLARHLAVTAAPTSLHAPLVPLRSPIQVLDTREIAREWVEDNNELNQRACV